MSKDGIAVNFIHGWIKATPSFTNIIYDRQQSLICWSLSCSL